MPIKEARLKDGILKLGTTPSELDFSCQVTNARINSSYDDDGDAQETLCGDMIAAGRKLSGRSLAGTYIQDWTEADAADSISLYCFLHDLEVLAFEYTPNAVAARKITGSLRMEVPGEELGGDVNARITSDFEWQITTELVFDPPLVGVMAASTSTTSSSPV